MRPPRNLCQSPQICLRPSSHHIHPLPAVAAEIIAQQPNKVNLSKLDSSSFLQMPRAGWDARICSTNMGPASCDIARGAQIIVHASLAHLLSNAGGLLIVPAEDSVPLLRREVQRLLRQKSAVSRCIAPSGQRLRQLCKGMSLSGRCSGQEGRHRCHECLPSSSLKDSIGMIAHPLPRRPPCSAPASHR